MANKPNNLQTIFNRVQMLKESQHGKDWTLFFPKGKSLYDVDWLGFISRKKKVSYINTLV